MPIVQIANVSGQFGTYRPFQTSFLIRSEQGLLRFRTMEKTIIFPDNQDFTDERFDELKDELLTKRKNDFNDRFKKARDKKLIIMHEYELVENQANEFLEVFGNILLHRFQMYYGLRSKTIREIISDFAPHTMESSKEWKKHYTDFINHGFLIETHDPNLFENMVQWLKLNPHFYIDPSIYDSCFFDLRRNDGMYYFEKLVQYQARLEYYDMICDLKDRLEEGSSELETEFEIIFFRPQNKIVWTGRENKSHKIDFIKLVIALHYGGMINDGNRSYWAKIRQLAPVFGVHLGNNPRSSLSDHLNYKNEGHDPLKFFDDLKAAFEKYYKYSRRGSSD